MQLLFQRLTHTPHSAPATSRRAGPRAAPSAFISLLVSHLGSSQVVTVNTLMGSTHLLGHSESFLRSRAHRSPLSACRTQCNLTGKMFPFL